MFSAIPSASTVQGVLPIPAAISMASPVPNIQSPAIRINRVLAVGLVVMGSVALHHVVGTSLAGCSNESTPIGHDGLSVLNPIGKSGYAGCPCHYPRSPIRVIGDCCLNELVLGDSTFSTLFIAIR